MARRGRVKKKRDEGLEGGSDGGEVLQPQTNIYMLYNRHISLNQI